MAQDHRGRVGGFVQSTLVKLESGAAGHEEQPPNFETALGAVLQPGLQEALYERVVPIAYRPPDEVDERSTDVILQTRARPSSRLRSSFLDPPAIPPGPPPRRC